MGIVIGCIALFIWSLGAKIRLLGFTMGYVDFLYAPLLPVLGTFRAVGRFAWGMHYLIVILLFLWLAKLCQKGQKRFAFSLALLASAIQFAEIANKRGSFIVRNEVYKPLARSEWSKLLVGKTTIDLVPPDIFDTSCSPRGQTPRHWIPLAILAVEEGLKFNSGARGNPPEAPAMKYCEEFFANIEAGHVNKNTAYVIGPWTDPKWLTKLKKNPKMSCHHVTDGYDVCI